MLKYSFILSIYGKNMSFLNETTEEGLLDDLNWTFQTFNLYP